MAKVLVGIDFGTFNCIPASNRFTLIGTPEVPIKISGLLLITNLRTNDIIFNFASSTLGYVSATENASNGSLTIDLDYNMSMSPMLSTDPYQIWAHVNDNDVKVNNYREDINAIRLLTETLVAHTSVPDAQRRVRIIADTSSSIGTVSTVTTVTTVNTVSNISSIGGSTATPLLPYLYQIPLESLMSKIAVT